MAEYDALARSRKNHVMFSHHIATANGGKANIAALPRTGDAVAAPVGNLIERNTAPGGGRLAQHESGTRGGVDLLVVMRLDDLDIEIFIQSFGDLAGELHEQVHSEAHVAGTDDGGVAGSSVEPFEVLRRKSGGTDHVDCAGLCGTVVSDRVAGGRDCQGRPARGQNCLGYGLARTFVEGFRQADAQFITEANPWGYVWRLAESPDAFGLTMGQVLSLPMVGLGLVILLVARRRA